jgi:hypothetical protein
MALRPGDFKATGERQRIQDLANSLPCPVSEESEEGRRVRGSWTPRWTPVPHPPEMSVFTEAARSFVELE